LEETQAVNAHSTRPADELESRVCALLDRDSHPGVIGRDSGTSHLHSTIGNVSPAETGLESRS